jgi:hypothetical protein
MLSHAEIKQSTVDNIGTITEEYTARSEIREIIDGIARVLVARRRLRSTTEYWEEGVLGVKYRCLEVGCSERQRAQRREELEKHLKGFHSFGPPDKQTSEVRQHYEQLIADGMFQPDLGPRFTGEAQG